ncbi:AsmA family protein [Nafulsella turpanensis]|uniref:AsmA family protein n=1 Tax=Nafulsella turpanensis TaxID=1265690 RepID=UPI00034A679B|nr:AsmA-like C-terminal region-containing protein [Nafulsella turpanensis]
MGLKRIYRFFVSLLLGLILLVLAAFTFVHLYQDEIVALFIRQANQYINTPVQTDKVSVSLFTKFPDAAISLENVRIQEGFAGSEESLAVADRIYFTFSLLDLIHKEYKIREVYLEDAEINLRVRADGSVNYEVISNQKKDSTSINKGLAFDIEGIRLLNVKVNYSDLRNEQLHRLLAKNVEASLQIKEPVYTIALAGKLHTYEIKSSDRLFFQEQEVELDTRFTYHTELEQLRFEPSNLLVGSSAFQLKGTISTLEDVLLDLSIETPQTDFQTLAAILPAEYTKEIRTYRSKGELKLIGKVQGTYSTSSMPAITVDFSAREASFFHPDYGQALESITLNGRYTNGESRNNRSSSLQIDHLQASLNDKPINGSLVLRNFDDYHLTFKTKSQLDATSLLTFYPLENVQEAGGMIDIDISFAGRLKDLEKAGSMQKVKAEGEIMVRDLNFKLTNTSYPVRNLNGSLIFNNNDLALSDLSGYAGKSSFVINGLFKNIFSYLLLDNQPLTIEADLQSDNLDLDELLTDAQAEDTATANEGDHFYAFDIRPNTNLYFNCKVARLKFDRFKAKNVSGELRVANGVARAKNVRLEASGGSMAINGQVDARKDDLLDVKVEARFNNIYVDSTFWIFRNFNQNFLTHHNLKGRVTANVSSTMAFDKKLRFKYDQLLVNANASIVDGQLREFEPMQNLSTFIKEDRLADISFSEITSNIQVRNQTIYLPETIIRSDISAVTIRGDHTFDQHIDYHVKVPVQTLLTGKRREMPASAMSQEGNGMHLFLHIKGTTDDYTIAYDANAVKKEIVKDIRQEGKELKEAIQNKTARTREAVVPDEEEYFDW